MLVAQRNQQPPGPLALSSWVSSTEVTELTQLLLVSYEKSNYTLYTLLYSIFCNIQSQATDAIIMPLSTNLMARSAPDSKRTAPFRMAQLSLRGIFCIDSYAVTPAS